MPATARPPKAPNGKSSGSSSFPSGGPLTYADSGVDIDAGDKVVDLIKPILRRTHGPRVLGRHGAFAGMFRLDFNEKLFKKNYKDPVLVGCTDGVGTKVKLAAQLGIYDTVGIDCVAMNVNDLIVQGAEPLFFLDYLGLHKTIPEQTAAIIAGVAKGCEIAGCALIGGECAEMPDIYQKGDFDIAGFAVGVVELERVIDAARVEKGDIIIGLASSGVHSNGYSLVRKIIDNAKLKLDKTYPELSDSRGPKTLAEVLMEPTTIYAKPIVKLLAGYTKKKVISGMAHITGSGLPGNVCRALPDPKKTRRVRTADRAADRAGGNSASPRLTGLDAKLITGSWDIPPIFEFLQKHGRIETKEMYNVFNMGIGYTLIVRPAFADAVVDKLRRMKTKPRIIGEIVKGSGNVVMV